MPTVLVIDDDVRISDLLMSILEEEGYRVVVAHDGCDGLGKAYVVRPDLILSDIMLPVFDGFQVAMALHLDPTLQQTPVVLMSAGLRPRPCRDGSWAAFLPKPFDIDRVVSVVAQYLH